MPFEFIATRKGNAWIIHAAIETEVWLRPADQGPVKAITLEYDEVVPTREQFSKLGATIYHSMALLVHPRQMYELFNNGGVVLRDAEGELWHRSYPGALGAAPINNRA